MLCFYNAWCTAWPGCHGVSTARCSAALPSCPAAYAATEACAWQRVLVGEVHDENAWAMGGVAGHAGVFATAEALWQFAHALLDTAARRRQWLPATLLRHSWQRQPGQPESSRALGWDTPTPGRSSAGALFPALHRASGIHWHEPVDRPGTPGHRCSLYQPCTPSRQATGIMRLRPAVHNLIMQELGVAPA